MEVIRPLDVLANARDKEVLVTLKGGDLYKGKLKAFDIHLNLVLYEALYLSENKEESIGSILIRGDTIMTVKNL